MSLGRKIRAVISGFEKWAIPGQAQFKLSPWRVSSHRVPNHILDFSRGYWFCAYENARIRSEPIFVFNSATEVNSIMVLTELKHNGRNVLAAVRMDSPAPNKPANVIVSLYDKGAPAIQKWISGNLLLYVNQEKARRYFLSSRLQLPREGSKADNKNLLTEEDVVNRNVNPESVSKVVDENGEPLVVYHGTRRVFETSENNKPRLVTKTVWAVAEAGVKSNPTQVYTPDRTSVLLPASDRVNHDSISVLLLKSE